jgi:UDP-N-acetyl-2-amino-2-deoxyglucuronate dehydrogenase
MTSGGDTSVSIGVGVIGAGAVSGSHAAGYLSADGRARLIAVADVDLTRAREMQRRFCFDTALADYRDLLQRSDISVVSICTPPSTHATIVLDAVRAGKHVLCEKPMATSIGEVDAIADLASERPALRVSCVYQHRDDPALLRARWILGHHLIGEVSAAHATAQVHRRPSYYAKWRTQAGTTGGGALIAQGIHLLDSMIWLLGDVRSVSAAVGSFVHNVEAEDTFAGWARLTTGLATVDCSTCAQRDEYAIDILGQSASLHLRYRPGWARTWRLDVRSHRSPRAWGIRWRARRSIPRPTRARASDIAMLAAARAIGSDRVPRHLGHGPHIRMFLDAVEHGGRSPVPPREARRSVELAAAFYRSALSGEAVALPLSASEG